MNNENDYLAREMIKKLSSADKIDYTIDCLVKAAEQLEKLEYYKEAEIITKLLEKVASG